MRILVILLLFCSFANGQIVDRFTPFPVSGGAMPVYEDSGAASAVLSTSVSPTISATVDSDDILIAHIYSAETVTVSPPASDGWNEIHQSNATNATVVAYWKRADGTEDSETPTFTHDGAGTGLFYGQIHRFSGAVTSGTPYEDNTNQAAASQQNPTHNIEAMTSTAANRLAVGLLMIGDNRTITTDAVDYTNQTSVKTTVGLDGWLRMYTYTGLTTADTIGQNTVDFDQNEPGGTVNFLLLPQ